MKLRHSQTKPMQAHLGRCGNCGARINITDDEEYCQECRQILFAPDWKTPCSSCGAKPTVPVTGLCGPCTFGDSETIGGNWEV